MRHLDLFSGIGGFALAARMAGEIETIGFCEINPFCRDVLKKHWPDVPITSNIFDLRGDEYGAVDLVTGGFPCQPYSVAGKRRGNADDRALWPEMLRVICTARPRWVLGENVPGIINMELDNVLSDLESAGYAARPIVIPACAVDAKHRRDRVWIVGYANSEWTQQLSGSVEKSGMGVASVCSPFSNSDSERRQKQRCAVTISEKHDSTQFVGKTVSNTNGINGRSGACDSENRKEIDYRSCWWRKSKPERQQNDSSGHNRCEWPPEPNVGRVVYGLSSRMDGVRVTRRLKALGNAIVPQVAAAILRMILEQDRIIVDIEQEAAEH